MQNEASDYSPYIPDVEADARLLLQVQASEQVVAVDGLARQLYLPDEQVMPDGISTTDRRILDLIPQANADDKQALDEIFRYITPLIEQYCRAKVPDYNGSQDIAQETAVAVLNGLPTFRDQGKPFMAFVYRIARDKVLDYHRTGVRMRKRFDLSGTAEPAAEKLVATDAGCPEAEYERTESLAGVIGLLDAAGISGKQRDIILYRLVHGLSVEETAELVHAKTGTVRVNQHRALNKLRQALASSE